MSRPNKKPGPDIDPDKLRQAREARGMNDLSVIADVVGVGENQLINIEKGHSKPSATTLLRLCLLYKVPVESIATRKNFEIAAQ